jgi:signal transduction histidine kinase
MKRQSPSDSQTRLLHTLNQFLGYSAAVLVPWIGTVVSMHTSALQSTPLAFSFACIAGITIFTGFKPGVVASVANALFFNYLAIFPAHTWSIGTLDFLHTLIILFVGLLITYFCQRQITIGQRLSTVLIVLQARSDALTEAQQGGNSAAWSFRPGDRYTEWEEGGAQVFGRPFSEISSFESLIDSVIKEDREQLREAVEEGIRIGAPLHQEFRVVWPNGETHWLESRGKASVANPGIWRGVTIDVTERKTAESILLRSEKLAAIGRLSATIAHEINNPLESITNLIYLASSDPSLSAKTSNYLRDADREISRLANIARRTLAFARSNHPAGPADLVEVIDNIVAMFGPRCNAQNATLLLENHAARHVAISSDELWQILTNLISNACDALPRSGGVVKISSQMEDGEAVIYVADNGTGIAGKDLDRIFDPFFTTKQDVGTGIGLWVTKELVEKNGGSIAVLSGDAGAEFKTVFRVGLPPAPS